MHTSVGFIARAAAVALVAAGLTACSLDSQTAPSLIGPSGFAQSITLSASPDRLPRDGRSQAVVTVTVRNESGQPVSGQRLTVSASAGTLSAADVVTGSDGRATVTLTAPPAGTTGNTLTVFATPQGANFDDVVTRSLSIALTGTANATAPSPQFTISPESPGAGELVTFDASGTTDEGALCGAACTFSWDIGGTAKTGSLVTHTFSTAGVFTVKLTVTDAAGTIVTTQRNVTVSTLPAPDVTLTVSPNPPKLGKQATFTATATAADGHSIVKYDWTFGDGTSQTTTTPTANKTFSTAGVYVVTVTATDDLGQKGSQSLQVSVANVAPPTVTFTVSPTSPLVGQTATFTATGTPATGHSITQYTWNFGDGSSEKTTASRTITHTFTKAGIHVVTVTATDDLGQTGSATSSVTVSTGVVVDIRMSPTNPRTGETVRFDPSGSTIPAGITVKEYVWDFGNGNTQTTTPSSPVASTTYSAARTYTVRLDIVDTEGRITTGFTTVSVTAP